MEAETFKLEHYKRACHMNQTLRELYNRLNLPYHNFYALSRAISKRDVRLHKDNDYLILLVSAWSPIQHLLGTFTTRVTFPADFDLHLLERCEPEKFRQFWDGLTGAEDFYRNSCESSLNVPLRVQAYYKLMCNQWEMICAHKNWVDKYNEHQSAMAKEIAQLKAKDDYEPVDYTVLKKFAQIFEEYVKNLMVDPKNRRKYKPVLERVRKYIGGLQEEEDEGEDSTEADDVLGTIFEQLIINATRYDPLSSIGPIYVCWIFKNRIIKIGNAASKHINLMLNESDANDCFPFNDTFHADGPSIADESQIYLFDEICQLWNEYNLGDTRLSKFLFERITPFYLDFMKTDTKKEPSQDRVTHQYVSYPVATFSSYFLQRSEGCISKMLYFSPEVFSLPLDDKDWIHYLNSPEKDTKYIFKHLIAEAKREIAENCGEETASNIDYKEHIKGIRKIALQEKRLEDYAQVFWLDQHGIGSQGTSVEHDLEKNDFILRFTIRYPHELQQEHRSVTPEHFALNVLHTICSKKLYQSYYQDFLVFSKRALFREYSEEQYSRLSKFCGVPLLKSDTLAVTPVHFREDGTAALGQQATLAVSVSKSL